MYRLLAIALGAILLMLAAAGLIEQADPAGTPSPQVAETGPAQAEVSPPPAPEGVLVLKRGSSGQFHLSGEVNGQAVRFLVDTGADVVALTEDSAEAIGIQVPADAFQPIMQTASGTGYGAPVMLDSLRLAESELRNVEAVVVQGLGVNLLGQNVLRRMGHVTLQGDRMLIQAR